MSKTKEVALPFRPHRGTDKYPGGQVHVIQACLNYEIVVALFGRSFGKTLIDPLLLLEEGGRCKEQVYGYAYSAPTFRLSKEQYRFWKQIFRSMFDSGRGLSKGCSDSDLIMHLKPWNSNAGAEVHFWGLDDFDNLRGFRKHRLSVDEGKDVEREAVFDTLIPMRLGRSMIGGMPFGGTLIKGTPKRTGKGAQWLRETFYRGLDELDPKNRHIYSITAPSHGNPHLTEEEIQKLIDNCEDKNAIREEIYAEILEDDASVFTNLAKTFSVPILRKEHKNLWIGEDPDKGSPYVSEGDPGRLPDRYCLGWDIGRSMEGDPSVVSVFNLRTRRQAALLRMPGLPFPTQLAEIHRLRSRYNNAVIHFDGTGIGGALADELSRRYRDGAVKHVWNAKSKEADITRGRLLCAHADDEVSGPGWYLINADWQKREFDAYSIITVSASGKALSTPKYEAPKGLHDDAVCASLICSDHLNRSFTSEVKKKKKPGILWTGAGIPGEVLNRIVALGRKKTRRW